MKGGLQADLQSLVQQQILTQIDSLVNLDHTLFDSGLVAAGSSSLGAAGTGISASAAASVQKSERLKFETFIMLVTQCF